MRTIKARRSGSTLITLKRLAKDLERTLDLLHMCGYREVYVDDLMYAPWHNGNKIVLIPTAEVIQ